MENVNGEQVAAQHATEEHGRAKKPLPVRPTKKHPQGSTRTVAERLVGTLARLCFRTTRMTTSPDLIIRLVDARTGEHLANAFIDLPTADVMLQALNSQTIGRPTLHLVGGDR